MPAAGARLADAAGAIALQQRATHASGHARRAARGVRRPRRGVQRGMAVLLL
jgi:hypothetical protein